MSCGVFRDRCEATTRHRMYRSSVGAAKVEVESRLVLKFEAALFLVVSATDVDERCQKPDGREALLHFDSIAILTVASFQRFS